MTKTRIWGPAGTVALTLVLAGCQGMGPGPGQMASRPMTPAPQMSTSQVDGEWASTDGVAISRFSNGRFETVATDTGNRLAEGTYTDRGQGSVEIMLTSLIRQTTSRVNCQMAGAGQLNCTGEAGNQFSLIRSQGVS
ncbi:hypothetical protein PZ895_18345 [Mesorhizobium sp. YIM 152430]|uniref:hypothetical protein n=1 Tax=Mesorhizobium sp. YIM 152430 TaxID=3031761 RepID=UPI0023DCCA2F|nr:hypothetical protein [Mesorhizobium sp. YIM 152430]MDF1601722.1 hypothetical protein [Mesorhizobium sp. YIM 152430]